MEKNEKESKTSKQRSYFVVKVLLFVLCVAVVVLLAACGREMFRFLKRFKQQNEYFGRRKDFRLEVFEKGEARRSKRGIDKAEFKKAMIMLEKLEGR